MAILTPRLPDSGNITNYGITMVDWTKWQITLSRSLTSTENLGPRDIRIDNNPVTDVSVSGIIANIILTNPVTNLSPSDITIHAIPALDPAVTVTQAVNLNYQTFIKSVVTQIRSLLDTRLTEEDLPDSIIEESVYIRQAELQIYQTLGLNPDATLSGMTLERARIAAMYHTAAILLYSNPQIVQQSFERSGIRFAEIDIDEKYTFLISFGNDAIEPDIPDDRDPVGTVTVSELINRKLCW